MAPLADVATPAPIPAYGYAADAVVVVHFLFMAFIVFGQLAIIIAAGFKWQWGRNPWFRYIHLAFILFVVYEALIDYRCPLTTLEDHWRQLAGQTQSGSETFLGHYAHEWLFFDERKWKDVIFACTICFGIIVLQGIVMYPPRWFWTKTNQPLTPNPSPARGEGREYPRITTAEPEKSVAISNGVAPHP